VHAAQTLRGGWLGIHGSESWVGSD
jgi:hypothetical protein